MALDILSILAMLANPERLFFSAKITVFNRQNRLSIYTVKALKCLKSQLKISTFADNEEDDRELDETIKEALEESSPIEILEQYVYCHISTIYCL